MKTCLIVASDLNYINYAEALIKSCKKHSPDVETIYRYVNNTYKKTLEDFADEVIFDRCTLSEKRSIIGGGFDINHPRNKSKNIMDRMISPKRLYCTHVKFSNCKYALSCGFERVIVSDADTIIRGDLLSALDKDRFNNCDIIMKPTQSQRTHEYNFDQVYEEGFFVVNNTVKSTRFIEDILSQLKKHNENKTIHLDSDTIIIGNMLNKDNNIKLTELPTCLKDEKLNDKSIVWSGRAGAKDNYKFKNVMSQYIDDEE